jgi:DNA-binding beta-propeller fold protein YncE/cytochrome c peroxidase
MASSGDDKAWATFARVKRGTSAGAVLLSVQLGCGSPSEAPSGATPSASSAKAVTSAGASASTAAPASASVPVREGSAIARAAEDDALFVADEDHSMVRVIALPVEVRSKRADVAVPGRPAQVLALPRQVLVTVRQVGQGEGALLVLGRRPDLGLEETGRVSLPADAWGVAVTPDEGTALVSSAWTHRVSAVDLRTLKVRWSADVAREPRGIVVMPGGDRAYVSHLVGSSITRIDGLAGAEPSVKVVALPASPLRSPANVALPASLGYAAVASPTGDRVYFPRIALGAMGPTRWYGAGAVDILMTDVDAALAPPRTPVLIAHFSDVVATEMKPGPNASLAEWSTGESPPIERWDDPLSSPRAAVYRRSTDTLLVANEGDDTVAELDALAMDPTLIATWTHHVGHKYDPVLHVPAHGSAPAGIALSVREDEAYVYCRGTDDVVIVRLPPGDGYYDTAPPHALALVPGGDERKDLAVGRALFYKADNPEVSGGLSCAACHPEGRDDGHVWHETRIDTGNNRVTNFFAGDAMPPVRSRWESATALDAPKGALGYARQTPMLAGRANAKGPYGWHGESADVEARLVAGFDLHRWLAGGENPVMQHAFAGYLATFIREGLVPPPRVDRPLTAEEARGKAVFESPEAQCVKCHVPETGYTDRIPVALKPWKTAPGFVEDPNPAFKTPSLLFVGGSPPYLHDGRFDTLEALIDGNGDRMGKTTQLSPDDRRALVAFLRTL